jgi:uncharacterized delta-60 repeat protein
LPGTSNGGFGILRYNSDGSLDASFDSDGKVTTELRIFISGAVATAIKIQTDGKIVAAGYAVQSFGGSQTNVIVIVRYNSDGSLDTSFDDDGIVMTFFDVMVTGMAIQPDGKIVVVYSGNSATNSDFAVARYNTDGSADTSFDTDGVVSTPIGPGDDRANAVCDEQSSKRQEIG